MPQSLQTIQRNLTEKTTRIPSFCIVLPCFNEEFGLKEQIESISRMLQTIDADTAIIAVNDGSSDNTIGVLTDLAKTIPSLIVEDRQKNGGYGAANRTGFCAAIREEFEYALVMDADGTQDPRFIRNFIPPMQQGIDLIKATRYRTGSQVIGVDWRRKLISAVGNTFARLVLQTSLTDYTNGFRAIKISLLKNLETKERGFAMLVEEVTQAKKCKATFGEVSYVLTIRATEGSKSKFTYNTKVYASYLKNLFSSKNS